jgi:hypothetical protein
MRKSILGVVAMAALSIGMGSAKATLLYSFETGDSPNNVDGFAPNGGGIVVSQDTIGATLGSNSMKLVPSGSFVGALTTQAASLATLNNPAVSAVKFDMTTTGAGTGYSDIGVTIFMYNSGLATGGQFQTDFVPADNDDLAPQTVTVTQPLIGTDPGTFVAHTPYATVLSEGWVPTGFEFFLNGSDNPAVYLDNVNTVSVPEPATLGISAIAGLGLLSRRRRKA